MKQQIKYNHLKKTLVLGLTLLIAVPAYVSATPRDVSHSTNVETRLDYLQKMLESRSGQRLLGHNNGETYFTVEGLLKQAQNSAKAADLALADDLAKQGFKTIANAIKDLPQDNEHSERVKQLYTQMHQSVRKLTYAEEESRHTFSNTANNPAKNSGYNKEIVTNLINQAELDADKGEYEAGLIKLRQANTVITASIHDVMNNRRVVNELDIGTPQKEYFYEVRRFQGYIDLIAIAIDVKKPSEMVENMMIQAQEKARWMADQARGRAIKEDYPVAIRMMMDATMEVKNTLQLVGINM